MRYLKMYVATPNVALSRPLARTDLGRITGMNGSVWRCTPNLSHIAHESLYRGRWAYSRLCLPTKARRATQLTSDSTRSVPRRNVQWQGKLRSPSCRCARLRASSWRLTAPFLPPRRNLRGRNFIVGLESRVRFYRSFHRFWSRFNLLFISLQFWKLEKDKT